jgi:hypothetical protein
MVTGRSTNEPGQTGQVGQNAGCPGCLGGTGQGLYSSPVPPGPTSAPPAVSSYDSVSVLVTKKRRDTAGLPFARNASPSYRTAGLGGQPEKQRQPADWRSRSTVQTVVVGWITVRPCRWLWCRAWAGVPGYCGPGGRESVGGGFRVVRWSAGQVADSASRECRCTSGSNCRGDRQIRMIGNLVDV